MCLVGGSHWCGIWFRLLAKGPGVQPPADKQQKRKEHRLNELAELFTYSERDHVDPALLAASPCVGSEPVLRDALAACPNVLADVPQEREFFYVENMGAPLTSKQQEEAEKEYADAFCRVYTQTQDDGSGPDTKPGHGSGLDAKHQSHPRRTGPTQQTHQPATATQAAARKPSVGAQHKPTPNAGDTAPSGKHKQKSSWIQPQHTVRATRPFYVELLGLSPGH